MTEAAEKIETESLPDAARIALATAGGDVRKAADALKDKAMADPVFLEANFGALIRTAAYEAVARCVRGDRRAVWNTPQPSSEERRAQVAALAFGTVRTLLDFPLPGGKKLGDASGSEVMQASAFYADQAIDMSWKSRWLRHVGQSVPNEKLVRDVLSAERLEELRQEVSR